MYEGDRFDLAVRNFSMTSPSGMALLEPSHPHEQVIHLLEGEFSLTIAGKSNVIKAGSVAVVHQTLGTLGRPSPHAVPWMSSTRCVKIIFRTACGWFCKTPKAFKGGVVGPEPEVTFDAILFEALSSPSFAQGCHNDHGGNQNQPPSSSPMIAAVPLEASAAVNRQNRVARFS